MKNRSIWRQRYKSTRQFAEIAVAVALIFFAGFCGMGIKCAMLSQDNAELEQTMSVLERQNTEYQQYINQVNLQGGGLYND